MEESLRAGLLRSNEGVWAAVPLATRDCRAPSLVSYLSRVTEPTPPKPEKLVDPAEKALRKLEAERGLLDPDTRYRAQINAMKAAQDLLEMGDRKARFALVVMSVLNAVLVLLVARGGESFLPSTGPLAVIVQVELAAYVIVTVFYVLQAIQALRPRGMRPPNSTSLPSVIEPGKSMRVLFHADVVSRSTPEYRSLWENLRMDNLTTELADSLHTLARITQKKYEALDRLYVGLIVMAGLLALFLATVGAYNLNR
jgi:hypothetical protein